MLHPERFFHPEPTTRKKALELYETVKELPIISPHGHVDPLIFADNTPFPDPASLFLIPDHYIFRMLYSQGIRLEELGVPRIDGGEVETDSRKIWRKFASHWYLFAGTPTGVWLSYEFENLFGITEKLAKSTADTIFDTITEKLQTPEFLPRALYERFGIEVLSTTDAATDTLDTHKKIRESGWSGRIVPCFRPDAVTDIRTPAWKGNIDGLAQLSGEDCGGYAGYIRALENRREFFRSMGATATDHAMLTPYTHRLTDAEAQAIYSHALEGKASEAEATLFDAHMLMEMARMSCEDGMTMQLHPGSYRNHNRVIYDTFGLDKGADIPLQTEFTHNLRELLNTYGNNPELTLIVFTLDETAYARELAPLAGHYPAMRLGPAWWFHDSIEGMTRYRQQVVETAGYYNTVGFNDDTRSFPSIPARHDLARRIDCNHLATQVTRHIIDDEDARRIARALAYDLAKGAYKL